MFSSKEILADGYCVEDGYIVLRRNGESEKILGTETHSLCKPDSWKKAITVVRRRNIEESLPALFMLSTDGFANSYKNEQEFIKTCRDYYTMIQEHGVKTVDSNLHEWLSETSEMGCGDDITVLMAYYETDGVALLEAPDNKDGEADGSSE